eukprot:CAMPEP_0178955020 /NCGR_PEP_ID=MMETSP0789-20121207/9355_1 /TAXON_ID=3005 /ORGANISM="Rhizosolenia setigera, Strain CCMP 1694" /LENGTH=103 /DNA_ID=CAMNT_0020636569 /DNA_START=52 /DNA_END=363 /DNA_ORIENTATION=-
MDKNSLTEEEKARIKEENRNSRLSFTKFGEHQLRREFKELAYKKCDVQIKELGKCAQEQGLWVVWSCRDKNRAMQECMAKHNSKEEFDKYKELHKEDIEKWKS